MKKLTDNKLAVVVFPAANEIDDDIYKKVISNKQEYSNIDRDRVYKNIRKMLEELNIPVIDTLEQLKQGQKEHGRVYHLNDTHFNYWGNDMAAREIKTFIKDYFDENKKLSQ